jgi:hypothetical protein
VKRVHNFRIPLSPTGQRIAQVVYFSIPVIGGYFIMDWATSKAREEIEFGGDTDRAAGKGDADRQRVLGNMRVDPEGRAAEERRGIEAQNEAMQKYLASLRKQQGQQRP